MRAELLARVKQADHSPLIDGDTAVFIHRGAARRVEIVGDFTGWRPRRLALRKVRNHDIRYFEAQFPRAARIEYKFIAGRRWIEDSLNSRRVDNGLGGTNSYFTMPGYRESPTSSAFEGGPHLERLIVQNSTPDSRRVVTVYLPPGYTTSGEDFPVLYLQDGTEYIARGFAAAIAERSIKRGEVRPFIIVFVDPRDRMREYWASDRFADWIARDVVPVIDGRFRTIRDRDGRALLGASLGGVASIWTAIKYPNLFGRVGGQSSSFWIDRGRVINSLAELPGPGSLPFRFYFDVGRIEGADTHRRVADTLNRKGYPLTYREAWTGHNWSSWRDRLAEAYQALWQ
ncbi:MAG: alpha/beta hydrolase-fold protein [Pyrinomonadaceae bacterium]